ATASARTAPRKTSRSLRARASSTGGSARLATNRGQRDRHAARPRVAVCLAPLNSEQAVQERSPREYANEVSCRRLRAGEGIESFHARSANVRGAQQSL